MKIVTLTLIVLMPAVVFAQNMNEQDMQKMMEQAMKMQACMQQVDQAEIEAFGKQAEAFGDEVKSLCDAGKRDQAQKKAIAFSKEAMKNSALLQMKKCSEMAPGLVPDMTFADEDYENSDEHVCDSELK